MIIQSIETISPAVRSSMSGRAALAAAAAVLVAAFAGDAHADDYLHAIGGPGGGGFSARCSNGEVLAGLELRVGDYVDAIRPLCVATDGPRDVHAASASHWHGGGGGGLTTIACPSEQPIASGLFVGTEAAGTKIVNNILLYCGGGASTKVSAYARPDSAGEISGTHDDTQGCPAGQVAVGVHGRSGSYLDAIGLICDARVEASGNTVKSIGRVGTGQPSAPRPPGWTICDAARDARGRNSPAAPNLEAQCAAAKARGAIPATSISLPAASALPSSAAVPAPTPAPPPSPLPSTQPDDNQPRAARDAAIVELIGSVVSSLQSRRSAVDNPDRRGPAAASAADSVDVERNQRRREPYPRGSRSTTHIDQDASAQALAQPENSIRIEVRYPTAYGYQEANSRGAFGDLGPGSCDAFGFDYLVAPQDPEVHGLIGRESGHRMRSTNGMYVCDYLISNLPLDEPITVRVAMSGHRTSASDVWLGGTQPRPGRQQTRTIIDGERQVVLTAARPSATLSFEMVYAGSR